LKEIKLTAYEKISALHRGRPARPLLPGGEHPRPVQPHQNSRHAAHFMAAFVPTGYVKFVKLFEFTGGILVMIPRLRNIGLLLLGPVIVNIIAFHVLIDDPKHLLNPMLDIIIVCALYLLWDARKKFSGLLN
jgi:hypothetical protein